MEILCDAKRGTCRYVIKSRDQVSRYEQISRFNISCCLSGMKHMSKRRTFVKIFVPKGCFIMYFVCLQIKKSRETYCIIAFFVVDKQQLNFLSRNFVIPMQI